MLRCSICFAHNTTHCPLLTPGDRSARGKRVEQLSVMGVDLCTWRQRIGCYSQPRKQVKTSLKSLTVKYISLSIRVALFYLLVAQCVEPNPGPTDAPRTSLSGTASGNRGGGRGRNVGRGGTQERNAFSQGDTSSVTYIGQAVNQRGRQPRRSERNQNQQQQLGNWLNSQHTHDDDDMHLPPSQQTSGSQDMFDTPSTTEILLDIQQKVSRMDQNFAELKTSVDELKSENQHLKVQNNNLSEKLNEVSNRLTTLEQSVEQTEMKREKLEAQSRRSNLKFYGFEENEHETWDETENKVRDYIKTNLKLTDTIQIERAHRLPVKSNGPRPVIVKFSFFKDKDKILQSYRENKKNHAETELGQSETPKIRVSEDFPERVSKTRSLLIPFLKEKIEQKKRAYLKYDKLIVDGVTYSYDFETKQPVSSRR